MSESKLHLFALVIGTGTDVGGDISPRYRSSIDDAEWLSMLLKDPLVCGYPKEKVKVLLGKQATHDNIVKNLDEIKDQVVNLEVEDESKKCTIVFFFSGHGAKEGDKTYLLPYGCNTPSKDNAISGDMLFDKFKAMDSGRVLLLLNACYSGAVMSRLGDDQESIGAAALFPKAKLTKLLNGRGFACLSASQPSQAALPGYLSKTTGKKYSPFTVGLARGFAGLSKKNYNDDLVYIGDLQAICVAYVSAKTRGKQIPHFDYKGDNFAVGYYKHGASDRHPLLGEDVEFDFEPEDAQVLEKPKPKFAQSTNIGISENNSYNNVYIRGNFVSGVGSYTN
ncbi:hypothetical protein BC937DRAFT_94566 [Endogone sp. FLAS-F59071]|nr:hypothetical protein BC937DRAFT_94566 [Endogone sp. FLAS-F59071]|eukprot:RUS13947.1 hypothetical protein BC937DRAFT_94566 [Endogone sp. FLAS-F59071]